MLDSAGKKSRWTGSASVSGGMQGARYPWRSSICVTISVQASVLSNCRIESKNRFVSVNRIESNYFSWNRNVLLHKPSPLGRIPTPKTLLAPMAHDPGWTNFANQIPIDTNGYHTQSVLMKYTTRRQHADCSFVV